MFVAIINSPIGGINKQQTGVTVMNDKQENQFSTYTVLDGFLTTNSTVVATIPAFLRSHQSFTSKLTDIKRVDGGRQSIKSG